MFKNLMFTSWTLSNVSQKYGGGQSCYSLEKTITAG